MIDFGVDLSLVDDLTEEMRTVSGVRLLSEALIRRWQTPRGRLLDDEDYGTDLTEFINEDVDELTIVRVRSEARQEALKDERVQDCTVVESAYDRVTGRLSMTCAVTVAEGDVFRLTVAITSVTIELLEVEE